MDYEDLFNAQPVVRPIIHLLLEEHEMMPENSYTTGNLNLQHLLGQGFSQSEAERLVYMKDHVTEQVEYREMIQESRRLSFIRWLIEHDRMSR